MHGEFTACPLVARRLDDLGSCPTSLPGEHQGSRTRATNIRHMYNNKRFQEVVTFLKISQRLLVFFFWPLYYVWSGSKRSRTGVYKSPPYFSLDQSGSESNQSPSTLCLEKPSTEPNSWLARVMASLGGLPSHVVSLDQMQKPSPSSLVFALGRSLQRPRGTVFPGLGESTMGWSGWVLNPQVRERGKQGVQPDRE